MSQGNKQDGVKGERNSVARQQSQELIRIYMRTSSFSQLPISTQSPLMFVWPARKYLWGSSKLRVQDPTVSLIAYILQRLKLQNICKHSASLF